jgi:hypothetical protein
MAALLDIGADEFPGYKEAGFSKSILHLFISRLALILRKIFLKETSQHRFDLRFIISIYHPECD